MARSQSVSYDKTLEYTGVALCYIVNKMHYIAKNIPKCWYYLF